jgi:predicted nucleotidyltransferase
LGDNTLTDHVNIVQVNGWNNLELFNTNVINQNQRTKSIILRLSDPDAQDITLTAISSDNAILPYTCIELCNSGTNSCMLTTTSLQTTEIPIEITATSMSGEITITIHATDSTGMTSTYAMPLRVNAAPTITGLVNSSIMTNSSDAIAFTISDTEISDLVITKESSDLTLVSLENIVISGTGDARILTITPTTNLSGTATITISVIDGNIRIFETFDINVYALFTENSGITLPGVYYGSSAFGDYDNDGDLDILLTGSSTSHIAKIYQNTGGSFSKDTGITLTGVYRSTSVFGDYDNDGGLDILLTGNDGSNRISKLYQNTSGSYSEYTGISLPGVDLGSTAFGDYDNDGDLDILLTGNTGITYIAKVFRNDAGNFNEDTGIAIPGVSNSSVAFGDYDNDSDLDILITGHDSSSGTAKIYRNDDGNFTEDTGATLPGVTNSSVAFGDYVNDGDLDLLITGNTGGITKTSRLFQNTEGNFTDTGIVFPDVDQGAVAFGDYDNDGDLDIFLTGNSESGYISKLYQNIEGSFSEDAGITFPGVYYSSAAFGDYDNDGDLDILLTGDSGSKIAKIFDNNSSISNTAPSAPSGLTSIVSGSTIHLSWSAGSDAETITPTGLNYNISIGSSSGGTDILAPMALPFSNGYRQISARGMYQNLTETVLDITDGTYYWRIQSQPYLPLTLTQSRILQLKMPALYL